MERTRVRAHGREIVVLGSCQGLEGEAEAVAEAIRAADPDVVALPLDPQVASHVRELSPEPRLGVEDTAYASGLRRWGDVKLPAPEFRAAIETAETLGARTVGVDLPEEEYLNRFTAEIGVLDLAKRALRVRWMKMRPPKADDPAAYCRRFDQKLNTGPFRALENAREHRMAREVRELAAGGRVAVLVEVQRMPGLESALEAPDSHGGPPGT